MPDEDKQKGNEAVDNGTPVSNKLPPPLDWVAGFIDKYFIRMPQAVQVAVFVVLVVYFIIGSVKIFAPEVWDTFWTDDVEIQGVLTKPNWEGVVDSAGSHFLSGMRLFVTKDHPNPGTPRYYFRWILKVDRANLDDPVFFSFMEGSLEKGTFMITPQELLGHRSGGYVRLEFTEIALTRMVRIGFPEDLLRTATASIGFPYMGLLLPQKKESYVRKRPIDPDSVETLLRRIIRPEYASAELNIRKILIGGGEMAMKIVADTLRGALLEGRNDAGAIYALVLSDFYPLYLFSTSPSYSYLMDDPFYEKACKFLSSRDEKERNYMATLLYNLQDARSLAHIFNAYNTSTTEVSKGLCLYAIDAFTTNRSPEIKKYIIGRLQGLDMRNASADLRTTVDRTVSKFQSSLMDESSQKK